nr:uncharacterized protein LOC114825063 [Malus domestica]
MNYCQLVQDVKLHITAKNLHPIIEDEIDNPVSEAEKATTMIFIRRHIHDTLQTEYHTEEDKQALWVILADLCRIRSPLKFCNETLTEEDLLKKTYSTFSVTNIVMQQKYKAYKFTKFSDLISVLLLAGKQNQLLMKNH